MPVIRWVPLLALVIVLTGCGSGASPPDEPAPSSPSPSESPAESGAQVPRTVTPADDGSSFTMAVGQTTTLRITDADEPEPELEGSAVLLIRSVNVAPAGAREWEVRAVEPGTAVIRGAGEGWSITLGVTE